MRQRQVRFAGFAAAGLLLAIGPVLTACTGSPAKAQTAQPAVTSSPSATPDSDPSFPTYPATSPVDAAAQHKADTWLAGAVVPPGAVRSTTRPAGVESSGSAFMWCTPMADAVGYWTVPGMTSEATVTWLEAHASQGMRVDTGGETAQLGDGTHLGGGVVDEPAPNALEALIFTVTPIGSGSGIRADAFTRGTDSVCQNPPPGTSLSVGG